MSADEAGRAASGAWKRLNVKGMNLLTQTDVGLNAVSSAILYDAVYRKEMKRNPGLSREEADRRAMMEVELSLSRKAQPMTPQQRRRRAPSGMSACFSWGVRASILLRRLLPSGSRVG